MTPQEFNRVYVPLSSALYRVAYHLLESEQDAMDVVQDVFLKLYSSIDRLDYIANPKSYAVTLVRNCCIDRIRAASRKRPEELQDTVASEEDIGMNLLHKEKLKRVVKAMEALPENQRTVLKMKVLEELSYEEISKKTGITPLTLRVLLSRARTKLKEVL